MFFWKRNTTNYSTKITTYFKKKFNQLLLENNNIFLKKNYYKQLKELFKIYIAYSVNIIRQEVHQYQTQVVQSTQNII